MKRRLSLLVFLLGCEGVQGELLHTPPVPDMAMTPECTSGVVGGATICGGEAELKQRVASVCTTDGLALTAFTTAEPCGAGQYRYAKYTCCPTTPQGPCTSERQGGNTSCKPEREWYNAAVSSCAVSRLVPTSLTFERRCSDMGDSYSYVKYLCCPTVTIK